LAAWLHGWLAACWLAGWMHQWNASMEGKQELSFYGGHPWNVSWKASMEGVHGMAWHLWQASMEAIHERHP